MSSHSPSSSASLMGIVFGFALEKSRVFEPGIIVGQMQLRNFIMLKVFLTAVATGAVVLAVLNGFGYVKLQPKAALYAADIVGGLILGAGITLAGACPGTTLAQIGAGYRDALFTLVGGLCGAVAFSYAQPSLTKTFLGARRRQAHLHRSHRRSRIGWARSVLAAVIVVILVALERGRRGATKWATTSTATVEPPSAGRCARTSMPSRPNNMESIMTANVGTIDRIARVIVGVALIAFALGYIAPAPAGTGSAGSASCRS